MSQNSKIVGLIVALAIVFGLIGALVSYDLSQFNSKKERSASVSGGEENLIEVEGFVESRNNNVIVNDRFVGSLDKNSKVVAVGSDGSMYVVKEGTVLTSDMVVKSDSESYSVYRINEPTKSVEIQR